MVEAKELPEDLSTELQVLEQSGSIGHKTWLVRDKATGVQYRITPETVKGRAVTRRRESIGPSIIVAMSGRSVIALHLPTCELYTTGAPPTAVR